MQNMPVLPYLEIPVVKHCNLNCRCCSHFANIEDKYFMPAEAFERDLARLSQLFSGITELRLLGGEPLLHPQTGQFIKIARRYFPAAQLKIVTNGLPVPSAGREVLRQAAESDVSFDISLYPPTQKILPAILGRLREYGIRYYVSEPITQFRRRLLSEPASDYKKAWEGCGTRNCFVLCEGRISFCYAPQLAETANKKYGYYFDTGDAIADIHDKKWSGGSLLEFLQRPHACCANCGQPEVIGWSLSDGKPDISDWFVDTPIK